MWWAEAVQSVMWSASGETYWNPLRRRAATERAYRELLTAHDRRADAGHEDEGHR